MIAPRYIWPSLSNYDDAFQNTAQNVHDLDIKQTRLRGDARIMRLNKVEKKYVSVYPMDAKNASWVVRCFFTSGPDLMPPPDIEERYHEINSYIDLYHSKLPFLVKQEWVPQAVSINGEDFPFIKSRFIFKAQKLGEFLEDYHEKKHLVRALATQFLNIMNTFEALHMAHGDLDITNILVCGDFPDISLRLVDFDCMYVPALAGKKLYENGHEHFQPVKEGIRQFDTYMDRFSALIIYLSLIALAENPDLWYRCRAHEEKKLLLGAKDYENITASFAYKELRKQQNPLLQKCLLELSCSLKEKRMPEALVTITDEHFVPREPKLPPRPLSMPKNRIPATPAALPKVIIPRYSVPIPKERLIGTTGQTSTPTPSPSYNFHTPVPGSGAALPLQRRPNIPSGLDDAQIQRLAPNTPPTLDDTQLQQPRRENIPAALDDTHSPKQPAFYVPDYDDIPRQQPRRNLPSALDDVQSPKLPARHISAYDNIPPQRKENIPAALDNVQPPKVPPRHLSAIDDISSQHKENVPAALDDNPPQQPWRTIPPALDDVQLQQRRRPQIPSALDNVTQQQPEPGISRDLHVFHGHTPLHPYPPTIQEDDEQSPQPEPLLPDNQSTTPTQPSRLSIQPLSWTFLIGIMLTFILALTTNLWIWFVLTFLFLVLFFAFLRK